MCGGYVFHLLLLVVFADGDGIPNFLDDDFDSNKKLGVKHDKSRDADGDGIPDTLDDDDDNDGLADDSDHDVDGNGHVDDRGSNTSIPVI